MSSRIYVLGAGSMGSLLAHELRQSAPEIANPTLLFKGEQRLRDFIAHESKITVIRQKGENIFKSESQLAAGWQPPMSREGIPSHIDNLIVATKTYLTEAALRPYIGNLSSNSNVLFLQNGMGVADDLRRKFWPSSINRPNFFQIISTHGAYKALPNVVHHVGLGKLSIGYIPKHRHSLQSDELKLDGNLKNSPKIIELLTESKNLNASYIKHNPLLLVQMEKLVVNACINPLSAVLDCLNGDLLYGNKTFELMKKVVQEAVDCFKAEYSFIKFDPQSSSFLDVGRLLNTVLDVCKLTASNSSSMREDVRHLNRTEIDWINGYIVKLGTRHRIPTPVNRLLISMVNNKLSIEQSIELSSTQIDKTK
ncbi:2-dehydropantoate 2-reductase [Hyphopichia burtonii NRRL Y-1933]|uniref:2-dehydropantoate 2-reductase n=1 Tax=Hyphopichia burtonii NRRL Y-1933 TaxID=984485 RepID=A0A1E4RLI5_9ASCO|nr:2-dehydropantoate 2-reductase [Hyphopichia burtonii NRRL Y-1933]ODV67975.1 2-dehydropantoate 2-reductase [Hyphopichia burtonii NRRL Y-1933]